MVSGKHRKGIVSLRGEEDFPFFSGRFLLYDGFMKDGIEGDGLQIIFSLYEKAFLIDLLHISERREGIHLHKRSEAVIHPEHKSGDFEGDHLGLDLLAILPLFRNSISDSDRRFEDRNAKLLCCVMESLF